MIKLRSGQPVRQTIEPSGETTMTAQVTKAMCVAAALVACSLTANRADAFWGHRRAVVTTAYALPSVPVTVGYAPVAVAPVAVARPVVVASPVVTAGYAPVATTYAAPVTTYYAPSYTPAVTTVAPATTTYYAPAATTTYYAPAPVTTYYAPASSVIVRRPVYVVP
jgi:hypothetical protein